MPVWLEILEIGVLGLLLATLLLGNLGYLDTEQEKETDRKCRAEEQVKLVLINKARSKEQLSKQKQIDEEFEKIARGEYKLPEIEGKGK